MNPRLLFPLLAAAFAVASLVRGRRLRRVDPMTRTWGLLALAFAFVSLWLQRSPA